MFDFCFVWHSNHKPKHHIMICQQSHTKAPHYDMPAITNQSTTLWYASNHTPKHHIMICQQSQTKAQHYDMPAITNQTATLWYASNHKPNCHIMICQQSPKQHIMICQQSHTKAPHYDMPALSPITKLYHRCPLTPYHFYQLKWICVKRPHMHMCMMEMEEQGAKVRNVCEIKLMSIERTNASEGSSWDWKEPN